LGICPTSRLSSRLPTDSIGVAIPYGIYDVLENCGALVVGVSHDTSAFAAHAIAHLFVMKGTCFPARKGLCSRSILTNPATFKPCGCPRCPHPCFLEQADRFCSFARSSGRRCPSVPPTGAQIDDRGIPTEQFVLEAKLPGGIPPAQDHCLTLPQQLMEHRFVQLPRPMFIGIRQIKAGNHGGGVLRSAVQQRVAVTF